MKAVTKQKMMTMTNIDLIAELSLILHQLKVGFSAFGITADMTGSKMLFAGIAALGIYIINKGKN